MRRIILAAAITAFAVSTAAAQSCETKAMSAEGKPLSGAAKTSFVKRCKRDACEGKAVSAEGQAAVWCGQEQLYEEVHEGCLTKNRSLN
jgi:hypothetical protein